MIFTCAFQLVPHCMWAQKLAHSLISLLLSLSVRANAKSAKVSFVSYLHGKNGHRKIFFFWGPNNAPSVVVGRH